MKAEDIMIEGVATCRASETLNRAAQLMWERRCGCVPVLDEAGNVVGMLTDRDVAMASYTQGKSLTEIPVTSAMSRTVHSCSLSTSIDDVCQIMAANKIRRVPVVGNQGRLVGLVSLTDVARAAGTWDGKSEVDLKDVALTLVEVTAAGLGELAHQDREESPEQVREVLLNSADLLKTLGHEVRVDLSLAGEEVRDRWKRLEARLRTAEAHARGETSRSLGKIERN
jgi:CBS domain-containing protein